MSDETLREAVERLAAMLHGDGALNDASRVLASDWLRDHDAALTAKAAEAALWPIRNLAMEHMNCTGCPTPWWLKEALARGEADRG